MTSDRWDPFREMVTFREAMDRWLQQSISGTGQLLSNMRPESIPIDVIERDDAFELRASLPGVRPEDVEVTVQGERVTIRAEARGAAESESENWIMREHRYGVMQQPRAWSGPPRRVQWLAVPRAPSLVRRTVANTLPEPQPLSHSLRRAEKRGANKLDEQLLRSSYVLL